MIVLDLRCHIRSWNTNVAIVWAWVRPPFLSIQASTRITCIYSELTSQAFNLKLNCTVAQREVLQMLARVKMPSILGRRPKTQLVDIDHWEPL